MKNFKLQIRNNFKGFSLIEMLVYVAILSVIMVMVVNTLILMTGAFARLRVSKEINTSAINILSKLDSEVKRAVSVDEALSIFDSSSSKLVLNSPTSSGGSEKIEFSLQGGVLKMYKAGVYIGDLSYKNTEVNNFVIRKIGNSTSGLKIELGLSATVAGETKLANFYDSVNLRNY